MIETLRYGHQDSSLYVDVPQAIFDEAMTETEYLARIIAYRAQQRVVKVEPVDGGQRLLLNTQRVGNVKPDYVRETRAKQLVYAMSAVAAYSSANQRDPNLNVDMGLNRLGDGVRLGMTAAVAWPKRPEGEVQTMATSAMRRTASQLKYVSPARLLPELVYAQVDREHGIEVQSNPIGACEMGTDGMFYKPDSPIAELNAHNIYSHSMQLICLSGLIAIARA